MGSKFGGGGVAGASESNVDRRERLRKLALETIDLAKVYLSSGFEVRQITFFFRIHIFCGTTSVHSNVVSV